MDFKENLNVNRARIGTVVFHAILLLLVIFIKPDNLEGGNNTSEKEGLLVPLGQANEGSESTAQASTVPEPTKTPDSPSKATENSAETKAVTQNDPNSPISASDNNEKSSNDADENTSETNDSKDSKDEQEPELTPEEIERQRKEAELNRRINTQNQGQGQGEGETDGVGDPGDPSGDILSPNRTGNIGVGNSGDYNLAGRTVRNKLKPNNDCNKEGVVVVSIWVDANGKVVQATGGVNIPNGPKSNYGTSSCLLPLAESAAKKTTWTPKAGADLQRGYIVYRFELQ